MAPSQKRKRGDRSYSHDANGGGRPSPHRPENLNTAQQNQYAGQSPRNTRRGSRGGARGGPPTPRSPAAPAPTATPTKSSPTTMSPPPVPNASRHSTALQPTTPNHAPRASPAVQPVTPVSPETNPYYYEYLSDQCVASWRASGRKSIVDAGAKAIQQDDPMVLATIFQEIVHAVLNGKIDAVEGGTTVKDILSTPGADNEVDPESLFLDSVSVITELKEPPKYFKSFVFATNIDPEKLRRELEWPLLHNTLELVSRVFFKVGVRKTTTLIYRMNAYNLLREESEGYSKLLTEYFTTVQDRATDGARSAQVVAETWERVKALIGAFDLDVGRVLDVTLDVAANMLIKRGDFFVKFFRISSWWPKERVIDNVEWEHQGFTSLPRWAEPGVDRWTLTEDEKVQIDALREIRDQKFWKRVAEVGMDAYFEIGGRRIIADNTPSLLGSGTNGDGSKEVEGKTTTKETDSQQDTRWTTEWIKRMGTLPPQGNRIAAQLLGFKLRFYASDSRDPSDTLPDNLIALTALLIKIGFISLVDLYPHLYPPDEDMPQLKEKLMAEKLERERKARPGSAMNALAMAGALTDDTLPAPVARLRAEESRAPSAKPDEKPGTPKAEEEKSKLPEPANQKYELLKSLLCMGCLPESLFILGRFPWLMDGYPDLAQHVNRLLHTSLKNIYEPIRPISDAVSLRLIQPSVAEAPGAKGPLSLIEGAPRRNMRWTKIEAVDSDGSGVDYRYFWETWADNVPLCQTVDDVFLLCDTLVNLSGFKVGQDPKLLVRLARIGRHSLEQDPTEANTSRWVELSKRLLVPALSLTKGNLGVVNEVYELLKTFPQQVRFAIYAEWNKGRISRHPDMKVAFDLTRARTKDVLKRISKTNIRLMARNLAKVTLGSPGVVFDVTLGQIESYDNLIPTVIECTRYFSPLAYDVLTWSLLSALSSSTRSRMQGDGMLTSPWLKALSVYTGGIFKQYRVMSPTPILQYVNHQLVNGNSTDLEILEQILTEMAGVRSDPNFNEGQTQAMGGGPVLQAQTLLQVRDQRNDRATSSARLLNSLVKSGIAAPLLISIAREWQEYGLRTENDNAPLKVIGNNLDKIFSVFVQYLEVLRANLEPKDFDKSIPTLVSLIKDFGLDPDLAFTISRASIQADMASMSATESSADDDATATKQQEDIEMKETPSNGEENSTASPAVPDTPWHPVLKDLMIQLKEVLPEDFEDNMSLSFYTSFWQLSLYDIFVPSSQYEEEQKRQKDKIQQINSDRTDLSAEGMKRKAARRAAFNATWESLTSEMRKHVATYQATRLRLKKESAAWFKDFPVGKIESSMEAIMQECFLPRIKLSAVDALFSFRMLLFMHSAGTPGFRTVKFLDQFFREKQLTAIIFSCTAREADNFGRFLNELLKELERWRADSSTYVKLAHGNKKDLPGFAKKLHPDKKPEGLFDYEDFRRVLYKWHSQLTAAFKACLTSQEYMHIRNAISILKTVRNQFPSVNWAGKAILENLKALQQDRREDIKLAATALIAELSRREKDWILPQEFRLSDPAQGGTKQGSRSGPGTPQPSATGTKPLSAAASDFKPGASSTRPDSASRKDVEDGEIDDAAKSKQASKTAAGSTDTEMKDAPPTQSEENPTVGTPVQTPASTSAKSSSTPAQRQSPPPSVPPRPDASRGAPTTQNQSRLPHALPSRPDLPSRRPEERISDYHSHGRGRHVPPPPPPHDRSRPLEHEYGRLDRPRDPYAHGYHTDPREREPHDLRDGRTPDRDRRDPSYPRHYAHDDRMRPPPVRDSRVEPGRPSWDGPPQRGDWDTGRDARSDHSRQPAWPEPGRERERDPHWTGPPIHPDRSGLSQPGSHSSPQTGNVGGGRPPLMEHDLPRSDREPRRDRGSRPHSPRRDDRRPPQASYPPRPEGGRVDAREDRLPVPPPAPPLNSRDRRDDPISVPPTGPRGGPAPSPHGRAQPGSGSRAPQDAEYGRLNRDFSGPNRQDANFGRLQSQDSNYGRLQQDPNYGRLNPNNDIPSGPRGRNAMGRGRNFTAPGPQGPNQPSASGPQSMPPSPAGDRTGASRDSRPPPQQEKPGPSSTPSTPASEQPVDLSGVHPSRLRQVQVPALQTDVPTASAPPSGPRGRGHPNSAGPGPAPALSPRNPPTGPAGTDRDQRTSQRQQNQLNNINNILQAGGTPSALERPSNNDRGASIRGRASRQASSTNLAAQASSQPSTPGGGQQPPPPVAGPPRPADLFASRLSHGEGHRPQNSEAQAHYSSQDERSDGRRRDGRERRSGRHRSRSRSPRQHGEARESREGREGERRRDEPRTEAREKWTNGETGGREPSGRETRGRGNREDGREHGRERGERGERGDRDRERGDRERSDRRERERGGGSNQSFPQAPPSGGRDGRKRGRGEDGMGHGDSKRPRRNG